MSWHAYRLVYRLESPLHIGWRKVGNLMQTRPYATGRAWWGATTANLTQSLGSDNYQVVGDLVRENLIFSYFFPALESDASPLIPCWIDGVLRFGSFSADEFERRFLSSTASTAIAYEHNTAAEGQLHEVEFIAPHSDSGYMYLVGHLLARESAQIECKDDEVEVGGVPLLKQVLAQARIGGERRYGFGKVRLNREHITKSKDLFGLSLEGLGQEKLLLRVETDKPLPSHCLTDGVDAQGEIEPLLGREWEMEAGPGRRLSTAAICWSPGSMARQPFLGEVEAMGIIVMTQ